MAVRWIRLEINEIIKMSFRAVAASFSKISKNSEIYRLFPKSSSRPTFWARRCRPGEAEHTLCECSCTYISCPNDLWIGVWLKRELYLDGFLLPFILWGVIPSHPVEKGQYEFIVGGKRGLVTIKWKVGAESAGDRPGHEYVSKTIEFANCYICIADIVLDTRKITFNITRSGNWS